MGSLGRGNVGALLESSLLLGTAHWECQSSHLVWRQYCRLPLCLIPCRLLVGSGANCSCLFWSLPRSAQKVEFSARRPGLWLSGSSASGSDFSPCLLLALPFHFVLLRTESGALYVVVKLSVIELYQFVICYCSSITPCSQERRVFVNSLLRCSGWLAFIFNEGLSVGEEGSMVQTQAFCSWSLLDQFH